MAYKLLSSNSVILIVDQSKPNRKQLIESLLQLGYKNIFEAEGTDEAVLKIEVNAVTATPINLIICNWKVASAKSLDFLVKIRSSPFSTATRTILVSSINELPSLLTLASKHIDGYIVTPHTLESLKLSLSTDTQEMKF